MVLVETEVSRIEGSMTDGYWFHSRNEGLPQYGVPFIRTADDRVRNIITND